MKSTRGRGRQRINPREFATTGPRTLETAANYLLHSGLRQDGGGDQRGVSSFLQPFVNDQETVGIPEQQLDAITATIPKNEKVYGQRIFLEHALDEMRKSVETLAHV